MVLPDRIGKLIQRLEAGETVTRQDVDRLATLQALDLGRIGEDFARERMAADDKSTADLGAVE